MLCPTEVVLYEVGRLLHGRPIMLKDNHLQTCSVISNQLNEVYAKKYARVEDRLRFNS